MCSFVVFSGSTNKIRGEDDDLSAFSVTSSMRTEAWIDQQRTGRKVVQKQKERCDERGGDARLSLEG